MDFDYVQNEVLVDDQVDSHKQPIQISIRVHLGSTAKIPEVLDNI
jgi:hypothetical protein